MMPLAVLMNRNISAVEDDVTLKEAAIKMAHDQVGAVLVRQEGRYAGILSETDIVRKALAQGMDMESCPVTKVMSSPLITIDIEQSVTDANELMSSNRIRHLVVTELGEVVGILSVRDLVLYFKNRL